MKILNEFIWLGEPDNKETHLELKKGETYKSSSVSIAILLAWHKQSKIIFTQSGELEKPEPEKIEAEKLIIAEQPIIKKPNIILSVKNIYHKLMGEVR